MSRLKPMQVRLSMIITEQEAYQLDEMAKARGGINRQKMIRHLIKKAYKSHVQVA